MPTWNRLSAGILSTLTTGRTFQNKSREEVHSCYKQYTFGLKVTCAIKMTPAVSVEWNKEAGLGVEGSARKPVNKKPEEQHYVGALAPPPPALC